jgi:hypothetical protein
VAIAAIFFALWVPIYPSETPKVGAFPWFYFYLLAYARGGVVFGTIAA